MKSGFRRLPSCVNEMRRGYARPGAKIIAQLIDISKMMNSLEFLFQLVRRVRDAGAPAPLRHPAIVPTRGLVAVGDATAGMPGR